MSKNSRILIALVIVGFLSFGIYFAQTRSPIINLNPLENKQRVSSAQPNEDLGGPAQELHPLSIASLRQGEYPGSELIIEQTLAPGSNYARFIASYQSEGLKQYGLLTIPHGKKPESGWPAIIFNHGYIPPDQYRTTERYIAYTDGFSRNGYVLFRPDYRGHGNSEGEPSGAYGSNDYTIDVLNAFSSIAKHPDVDVNRIGMWGHSMGGHITMRAMVVNPNIKAGVIWAGVVASYPDLLTSWRRSNRPTPAITQAGRRRWRDELTQLFGTPEHNKAAWDSISANAFLSDISGPLQLHHGTADASVPHEFSQTLEQQMRSAGKEVESYLYEGDDHNLSQSFSTAMQRSITFFDQQVKGATQTE